MLRVLTFITAFSCFSNPGHAALLDEVDPFIGAGGGGNTFPGAVLPWGMVSVSPHNDLSAPSGYKSGKRQLYGIGHVHLSGVGCPDLGNIVLMPGRAGGFKAAAVTTLASALTSAELAKPGYYRVRLPGLGLYAEMTASPRSGMSRFTFDPRTSPAQVLLSLSQALQPVTAAELRFRTEGVVEGFSQSGGFCGNKSQRRVYFHARLFPAPENALAWEGSDRGATFLYTSATPEVLVKIGISYVSADNARLNLEKENPGWSFDRLRAQAMASWEAELSKVEISSGEKEQRRNFYTALYHTLLHPNVFSDVDGRYKGFKGSGIKKAAQGEQYSVFSLWDTYRTVHPLLSLLWPERQLDMARSLAAMARDSGWLPKWELAGDETYIMVGDPALPMLAQTHLDGFADFDVEAVWAAAWKAANTPGSQLRPGLKAIQKYGYIPKDDSQGDWVWGSVSSTLEYALADWSLLQLGRRLGKPSQDLSMLARRAEMWKQLYDKETGFLRPKLASGAFMSPFDPLAQCCDQSGWPDNGGPGYVEGNAWQYTWFVPHDMPGLIQAMGGSKAFSRMLQACFDQGHFVLWNEPDMAYPWLFNYVKGGEWRTRKLVREAALTHFKNGPAGIPGNDDCGTTSAWYALSSLGFYPDNPAGSDYQLAAPLFEEARLKLDKGAELILRNRALGSDHGSHYWMGKKLRKPSISRQEFRRGGDLIFE